MIRFGSWIERLEERRLFSGGVAPAAVPAGWYEEAPTSVPSQRPAGDLRVLFIGNSFTTSRGGQAGIFRQIALAGHVKRRADVGEAAHPLDTLGQMLADPLPFKRIREKAWDYVVIQPHVLEPQESLPGMVRTVMAFDAAIRAAGAKTVLFEPWGREDFPQDETIMRSAIKTVVSDMNNDPANVALHRTALVAPVSDAWDRVRANFPKINPYSTDRGHPSNEVAYLTACTFYSFLYGKSAVGLSGKFTATQTKVKWDFDIPAGTARVLQRAAYGVTHPER